MTDRMPTLLVYALFGIGGALATYPIWKFWVFGFNPTLDDLLRLRCFGF